MEIKSIDAIKNEIEKILEIEYDNEISNNSKSYAMGLRHALNWVINKGPNAPASNILLSLRNNRNLS